MYNRGTKPLDATITGPKTNLDDLGPRDSVLRQDLLRLSVVTILAETLVRVNPPQWGASHSSDVSFNLQLKDIQAVRKLIGVIGIVLLELIAQYMTTLSLALGILWLRGWWSAGDKPSESRDRRTDGRKVYFK